ncbi:MAG: hypothetical protein KF831_09215 [Acidobacteria bacterium]|nr:hypothetical protein [Acidobacteriota bacterium]
MNGRPADIPPHKLISALRGYDLLPAIVFLPTRRKCDESASEVAADRSQRSDPEKFEKRKLLFDSFSEMHPEVLKHKHVKILVHHGVASHHAGHIPAWKLLVEKMMSAGLLNAIFATSTVAAGVDFPARTVVVSNADTRGNEGWRPLSANELQQMTGRAGRRGKDNVGFVVLAPGQFQNPRKIAELLKSPPDPLESKFKATYTTLLNLLDAFGGFGPIRDIAQKSYAFQKTGHRIERLRQKNQEIKDRLTDSARPLRLSFDDIRGFERLVSTRERLQHRLPETRAELRMEWLRQNVLPGRIVTQGRSGKRYFMVISAFGDSVSAMRDDGSGRTFSLARVNRIFENTYRLNENAVERAFMETLEGKNPPLEEPKPAIARGNLDSAEVITASLERFTKVEAAAEFLWLSVKEAAEFEENRKDIERLVGRIWSPFENRARVLDRFDFIDFAAERVTDDGRWLADLRIDRPLLIGEALRRGVFDDISPAACSGLVASIAADAERSFGELNPTMELLDAGNAFFDVLHRVGDVEWEYGIEPTEDINYSAAAAAEFWARGRAWDELAARTKAEEGDLFRLLSRTGEALMQIAELREANPAAASIAREAADAVLRDPIR